LKDGNIDDVPWDNPGTGWANTEFRSYQFTDESTEDDSMIETAESRKRRGKEGEAQPSKEEQQRLFKQGMQGWDDQGV